MQKLFVLCVAACFWIEATYSQNVIVLHHNSTPSFFTTLGDAVNSASSGDTIYLPGGQMQIGTLTIDKKLHIIGAGYRNDSSMATGRTYLDGIIILITGADSSSLEGFYLTNYISLGTAPSNQAVDNLKFSRLNVSLFSLGFTSENKQAENCMITECVIRIALYGYGVQNLLVEKCIVGVADCSSSFLINSCDESIIKNCIFLYGSPGNYLFSSDSNCVYLNNVIFTNATTVYELNGFNNSWEYNLCNKPISAPLEDSSYENVSNLFEDYVCGNAFEDHDFHLADPTNYFGNDATQVGIYGTLQPFKDGAFPGNPHISYKNIGAGTDANGNLQINIKVEAQDY